jgi:fatty-acyl-CoA synthase
MRGLYETTGAEVIHVYGATETTPLVAINYGIKSTLDGKLSSEQCWGPQALPGPDGLRRGLPAGRHRR